MGPVFKNDDIVKIVKQDEFKAYMHDFTNAIDCTKTYVVVECLDWKKDENAKVLTFTYLFGQTREAHVKKDIRYWYTLEPVSVRFSTKEEETVSCDLKSGKCSCCSCQRNRIMVPEKYLRKI